MKNLFLSIILMGCSSLFGQTTNFSIINKPFTDPELPNYHRGAQYWNGTSWDNSQAPQVPSGTPTTGAKTRYQRYWWSECESSQGVYTFTKASLGGDWWKSVEASLEWCANNGALFGFGGIMTSWDGQGTIYYDGAWSVYPQYLHNLMQAEPVYKDWKYNAQNCWVPNWNSQAYLNSWRRVNDTLLKYIKNYKITPTSGPWAGKLVEGWKIIDFTDLRGFGNYGEWHTYPWGDDGAEPSYGKATDSTFKKIIDIGTDIYGDYPLHIPVGAFDDNPWGEGTAFTTWYALTKKTRYGVLGWRRDNIGDPGLDDFLIGNTFTGPNGWKADTAILNRWKYAMITGEPLNGCCATCCPWYYHIRPEINNYHYSGFGNGNYGNNSQQTWDTINNVFKLTGYRYNLNGGSVTSTLITGKSFNVTLNWRNVGSSPLYQKRWKVKYELKNNLDQVIQSWISKLNLYLFLPSNQDSIISENFTLNNNITPNNNYKLTIKIEDSVGFISPLYLAINSPLRNSDGSYTLRNNITITSGSLPVTWYYFTANKEKSDSILLEWKTSCNSSCKNYEIQRSEDGVNFYTVGTVSAKYDCVDFIYKYKDFNINSKNLYYRIKQNDLDNNLTFSKTIRLSNSNSNNKNLVLYPNPNDGILNYTLKNDFIGNVEIVMSSSDGKILMTSNFYKNTETINKQINMNRFSSGIYFFTVYFNGSKNEILRIIKN